MTPEDVYALAGVSDPRLRPGGQEVAYVQWTIDAEANEYRQSIWLAKVDGSEPPRRFTTGTADGAPRWSPDGTKLAFLSKRGDEKAKRQLYVMPADGGEPACLTDLKENVGEHAWSPDGTRLVFSARVPDEAYEEEDDRKRPPRRFRRLLFKFDSVGWVGDRRQHLYVVPADGSGEAVQITDGDFEDSAPTWTPDDRIAFSSARGDDWDIELRGDVYLVSAEGGEPERLTAGDAEYYAPSYSPDGQWLAVKWSPGGFDFPRNPQVGVMRADGSDFKILTQSLDRTCDPYPSIREPIWDGGSIVFAIEDRGNVHVYRVSPEGGEPDLVLGGDIVLGGYDARDGVIVRTGSTAPNLSELYAGETQLTKVGEEFAAGRELVAPERFTAISADGETEVDAWIAKPAGFEEGKRYPLLLNIHGGPFTQYGNGFFDETQVYAGGGYVVVYANPRGSSGFTEEWGRAIMGPGDDLGPGWGSVDYEDLMGVVDTALEKYDFIDPERLGVIGGSYGGYMTSWIVSHSNRFKAAISERAVNNLVSMYGSSDVGWVFKGYHGAFVHDDVETYLRISPWTYAKEIETPLLILHSEQDLRCNIEQAEQLFTTLRLLKKEVELVRFPAESHELTRSGNPVHRVQRFELVLEWFDRYLK